MYGCCFTWLTRLEMFALVVELVQLVVSSTQTQDILGSMVGSIVGFMIWIKQLVQGDLQIQIDNVFLVAFKTQCMDILNTWVSPTKLIIGPRMTFWCMFLDPHLSTPLICGCPIQMKDWIQFACLNGATSATFHCKIWSMHLVGGE